MTVLSRIIVIFIYQDRIYMTKKIPAVLKQIRNGGDSYNFAN